MHVFTLLNLVLCAIDYYSCFCQNKKNTRASVGNLMIVTHLVFINVIKETMASRVLAVGTAAIELPLSFKGGASLS